MDGAVMQMIADHPYLAAALFLAIGIVAGWLANMISTAPNAPSSDDDITGIGA